MFRNALEPWHLVLIVLVLIVLFGAKRLPDLARSMGKSVRILKAETQALRDDDSAASSRLSDPPAIARPADSSPAPAERAEEKASESSS